MTRAQAAAFCGVSPGHFTKWVRLGIVPGPLQGTRRWSKARLSAAVEQDNSKKDMPREALEDDPETALAQWLNSVS